MRASAFRLSPGKALEPTRSSSSCRMGADFPSRARKVPHTFLASVRRLSWLVKSRHELWCASIITLRASRSASVQAAPWLGSVLARVISLFRRLTAASTSAVHYGLGTFLAPRGIAASAASSITLVSSLLAVFSDVASVQGGRAPMPSSMTRRSYSVQSAFAKEGRGLRRWRCGRFPTWISTRIGRWSDESASWGYQCTRPAHRAWCNVTSGVDRVKGSALLVLLALLCWPP